MAKNKSIDGLTPRRVKKTISASSFASPVRPTTSRTVSKPHLTTAKSHQTSPKNSTISLADLWDSDEDTTTHHIPVEDASTPKKHSHTSTTEDFLKPTQAFDFDEETGELYASDDPTLEPSPQKSSKTAKKARKHHKMSKKRKIIIWVTLVIVLILIAGAVWFILWGNDLIARITGGQGNIVDLITTTYEPLETDIHGRTNILAFGTSGFDMSGTDYDQSTHDGADLTDSIMVISLDQETGDTVMISLPRDLKVTPECTSTGKINEIYWCNNMEGDDEAAGATALMTEVGDLLGIDFQYYAHINWGSLESIVDALGGITVTLDEDVYDYYYTDAVYEAGVPYNISGAEAVGLARARHGTANGDFSRGASQQKILIGIKDKVVTSDLSISDLLNLASTLGDNLRTNFSVGEMKTLAHLAETLDFSTIRQLSFLEPEPLMTTADIWGISYVIPTAGDGDFDAIKAYIIDFLFPPEPEETETDIETTS